MNYKDFVNDLELRLIGIKKLMFERFDFDKEKLDALYFRIDSKDVEIIEKTDKYLRLLSSFGFDVSDGPDEKNNVLFSSDIAFEVYFSIKNIKEIPEGFLHEYKEDRLNYILHPYLRQVVSDSLQKAGLPPLFIPPLEQEINEAGDEENDEQ